MHCIVPFAAPASDAGRAMLATMRWPRLAAMLPRLTMVDRDEGEATSFSPPHERVLARALGWTMPPGASGEPAPGDGRWPFAARLAQADGLRPHAADHAAWGLVSPVHWHVGTDQVSLADPETLQLDDAASRAFFAAVSPLFDDDGLRFFYGHPTRWYVSHVSLQGLRTASLDRVVGRNVDPWLAADDASAGALRRWRRLQAEVQMLLHGHPLNAEREARGLLPVNSFWLSGCGAAMPEPSTTAGSASPVIHLDTGLRSAAIAEDWEAWAEAWRTFEDRTLLGLEVALRRGSEVWLTLCGERAAATFAPQRGGFATRLKNLLARPSVPALLASL